MINLAFSPCPNDTFIFDAIIHGRIDLEGLSFSSSLHDVETLNGMALRREPDMVKVSFFTWLLVKDDYVLLDSGSAMGFGTGPLLIGRKEYPLNEIRNLPVAIPGRNTTAHLLFCLALPGAANKQFMIFSEIEDAVLTGRADAGVIIHENRFTYRQKGLKKIIDLGQHWEKLTGSPVPLGGILVRKSLGEEMISRLGRIMHRSVEHALARPGDAMPFVREHAQEMDPAVMQKHIRLYVNNSTLSMGPGGRAALEVLERTARDQKLI